MTVNESYDKVRIRKLSPQKVYALMKKNKILVVDVRPNDFSKKSYIVGSIHCQTLDLAEMSRKLKQDKEILLVDWAMKQSPILAQYMKLNGFSIIGVLKGGVERWISEGLPSEKR
jgi:rhodanese-related sulfurtransferase